MMLRVAGVLVASLFAMPAMAQPSFDCSKATTNVERTICKSADLGKLDREMAALFNALHAKLTGAAKDHLLKDQIRSNGMRGQGCWSAELEGCLGDRYRRRIEILKFAAAGPYPFISEQGLQRSGKVKNIGYEISGFYPQFDAPGVDFSALNAKVAADTRKAADEAVPDNGVSADMRQVWTFDQAFNLHRAGAHAVSVEMSGYIYTGGAHGMGGTYAVLVDMRTGRSAPHTAVFSGNGWQVAVRDIVLADLKKQFVDRPGFDEALTADNIDKLLTSAGRWLFKADGLEIIFNQYEVGPYAAGPYYVDIPYTRLKPLMRADGPI